MMNRKGIVVFTKVLLDVMFYSGILVTASLPFTLKLAGKYYSQDFARLRACDRVSAEEDDPHGHCKGLFCGRKYEEPETDGKDGVCHRCRLYRESVHSSDAGYICHYPYFLYRGAVQLCSEHGICRSRAV